MENLKKEVLLSAYYVDRAAGDFNNRCKYMNFNHLMAMLNDFSEPQLEDIVYKIKVVEDKLKTEVKRLLEELDPMILELVESYDTTPWQSDVE